VPNSGNSIKVLCADGITRTATYRGLWSPMDRVFVRVNYRGKVRTITGRAERDFKANGFVFVPDDGLANSDIIKPTGAKVAA